MALYAFAVVTSVFIAFDITFRSILALIESPIMHVLVALGSALG